MSEKELSRYEMEKCKIEIEMKKNYYGAFVTNVLNANQIDKISKKDCSRNMHLDY